MGGRGSKSSQGKSGGVKPNENTPFSKALDNIMNSPQTALDSLSSAIDGAKIDDYVLTANGNSVKRQVATIANGDDKIEVYFSSTYDPMQVNNADKKKIRSGIYANVYKDGNVVGTRTLLETNSTSLKNAKSQYTDALSKWRTATKQSRFSNVKMTGENPNLKYTGSKYKKISQVGDFMAFNGLDLSKFRSDRTKMFDKRTMINIEWGKMKQSEQRIMERAIQGSNYQLIDTGYNMKAIIKKPK